MLKIYYSNSQNGLWIHDLPIEVKKLMENLVLAGSSLGNSPSNASAMVASRILANNLESPMYSANS